MVKAAIGAEEEYKDTLYADVRAHASMRIHIADYSLSGHASSKPASDGLLPVHPLVLNAVPATLQASTLKIPNRDASAERCPPAATLQELMGCGQGGKMLVALVLGHHPHQTKLPMSLTAGIRPQRYRDRPAACQCPCWL